MRLRNVTLTLTGLISSGALAVLLASARPASAQVAPAPSLMNFQGRLAKPDGTPVSDGTYSVTLSLWSAPTGGTQLWTETDTVTSRNGVFAVLLGSTTPLTNSVFSGSAYLQIQIGTASPLSPRQQVVSVAYALKANSVPDGSIGAAQIANGAITGSKLANGVLPTALPPTGAAGGDLTGTYPNPVIATNAVTNSKLAADPASLGKVSSGALSFRASGESVDQKQETSGSYYQPGGAYTFQQIFTAGVSGTLAALDINGYAFPNAFDAATLSLYQSGALSGGSLLSQQPISVSNSQGFQHFELAAPVSVTAGTQYRWELTSSDGKIILLTGANSAFSGANTNAPSGYAYTFRTYVVGAGAPTLAITPATAFYSNVGVGTTNPQTPLDVNGAIRCISLTQTSDARFKTHVVTLDNAMNNVLNLRGVSYDFDREKWPARNFPAGRQVGFLAQEIEKIFPGLVTTDKEGYKAVNYAGVVPVLVEAVKAQQQQLNDKQKQLDALLEQFKTQRKQIEDLKTQNAKLETMRTQLDALTNLVQQMHRSAP